MGEFLTAITGFPTVVFTVLMGVVVIYWLMVIVGALDIDLFHHGQAEVGGAADGIADGAAEAAGHGVMEGAGEAGLESVAHAAEGGAHGVLHAAEGGAHGALHAAEGGAHGALHAAEGGAHGATHGLDAGHEVADAGPAEAGHEAAGHGEGGIAWLLSALDLRAVPVTVAGSFILLYAWLITLVGWRHLASLAEGQLLFWILALGLLAAALFLALPLASLSVRPLGRLFVTHQAPGRDTLIGKTCTISTGHVDTRFGQATLEDGGAGLILQVRYHGDKALRRGDRALIIAFDRQAEAFQVVPDEFGADT